MVKTKTLLGSNKLFRNPEYLGPTDKVESDGPILGGKPKKNKTLSTKFMGCSANNNPNNKEVILEVTIDLLEAFNEFEKHVEKAGFIPYYFDQKGQLYMMFVLSSNPAYGGTKFMIAKGHVDSGEDVLQAALREANEECGLRQANLIAGTTKIGWKGMITGYTETSPLTIYIGKIKDLSAFDKPGYEISKTKWMTPEEFASSGRNSQVNIVTACVSRINNEIKRFK